MALMQLIYVLGIKHGDFQMDNTMFLIIFFFLGASGETIATWALTVVRFSFAPVFSRNNKTFSYKHESNVGPQMHFLASLYYDFQPPLCVDMKFVSIVKSDFMSNYFCRILLFGGGV